MSYIASMKCIHAITGTLIFHLKGHFILCCLIKLSIIKKNTSAFLAKYLHIFILSRRISLLFNGFLLLQKYKVPVGYLADI